MVTGYLVRCSSFVASQDGGVTLALCPRAGGAPVVQETNVQAYVDRVERVEAEANALLAKTHKLEEQRQLLEFKNRVLTEMVSMRNARRNASAP